MSPEPARAAILTKVQNIIGAYPDGPILIRWDNSETVSDSDPSGLFIDVQIDWGPGTQITMGNTPCVRFVGQLMFLISVRLSSGTLEATKLMDYLLRSFQLEALGAPAYAVVFQAARPQPPVVEKGRFLQPLALPFWTDMHGNT